MSHVANAASNYVYPGIFMTRSDARPVPAAELLEAERGFIQKLAHENPALRLSAEDALVEATELPNTPRPFEMTSAPAARDARIPLRGPRPLR